MKKARYIQAGVVTLLVAYSIMSYFDRTIISIAGPTIIHEFHFSATQMGEVYSAFILSYAILMVPGGHLADRLGPRLVLTMMGVGAAVFTALTALPGWHGFGAYLGLLPSLLLIRFCLGACTAPLYPSCARMEANWVELPRRAYIWGLIAAGAGIGSAITPPLCSWMIARYGWRLSFWQAAGATAALALLWAWFVRNHPQEHPALNAEESQLLVKRSGKMSQAGDHRTSWAKLLTDRNLILLTFSYFTLNYFEYIFFFWIYYYFGEVRHLAPGQTAGYTTAIFVSFTLLTPLGGWVSDRLSVSYGRKTGRRSVVIVGLTFAALALYFGTSMTSSVGSALSLALAMGLAGTAEGPFWSSVIDVGGTHVGAAGGIVNAGGNVGGLIAPVLTPFIASSLGWSFGLYIGCLVLFVGVLVWGFIDPTRESHGAHSVSTETEIEPA